MKVRNIFIIFIVSGFWHGANWTFIVWGALNAVYFLPLLLLNKNRAHTGNIAQNRLLPTFKELRGILLTFALTVLAWVFFRAENIKHALRYLKDLFTGLGNFSNYYKTYQMLSDFNFALLFLVVTFIVMEWLGRNQKFAIEKLDSKIKSPVRHIFYYSLIVAIFWFSGQQQEFIYFQF
jgi:D-alanyl-lipoteichoic acid acyltransferase DltB (MBOAT superfamily)